jgi:flagellum-specific peptidoglycan hydrolase FlgJ
MFGLGALLLAILRRKDIGATMNLFTGRKDFVTRLWAALEHTALSSVSKAIVIAHAAFESAWGAATATKYGHNYFNITAGSTWKGPIIEGKDLEFNDARTTSKVITQRFRKYADDKEAVTDYLVFLQRLYPEAYRDLIVGDMKGFIKALAGDKKAGGQLDYYTLPEDQYQARMSSVMALVRKELT